MSQAFRKFRVREQNAFRVTGQFVDEDGEGFLPDTITVLLYEKTAGEVINGRDSQDIRNTNGGECDAEGNFVWTMSQDDNAMVSASPAPAREYHRALLVWTWDGDNGRADIELDFEVTNTSYVP